MKIEFEEKTITETRNVPIRVQCDNCDRDLKPVFTGTPDCLLQPDNALDIVVSGGYGQFIDGTGKAIFCGECARKLFDAFPSLERCADEGAF